MGGTDILEYIKKSRPNWPRGPFSSKNITTTFFNEGFLPFTEFLGELTKYQGAQIIVTIYFFTVH